MRLGGTEAKIGSIPIADLALASLCPRRSRSLRLLLPAPLASTDQDEEGQRRESGVHGAFHHS